MNRRVFLKTSAFVGATGVAAGAARGDSVPEIARPPDFDAWAKSVWQKGERRRYRGTELNKIAFPLGGIGAGQVFLTGRGALRVWQVVNNFNANAVAEGACFGIWVKPEGAQASACLLQQDAIGAAPGVKALTFSGEMPFAWLDIDAVENGLPVSVALEAFSPMIPLNAKDSAIPGVVFRLTLRNAGDKPVDASILATAPNLIGWDGYAALRGAAHEHYIANRNTVKQGSAGTHLLLETVPGATDALGKSCALACRSGVILRRMKLTSGVTAFEGTAIPPAKEGRTPLFWLEDRIAEMTDDQLSAVLDAVQAGAGLVVSGARSGAVELLSRGKEKHPAQPIVFEQFEGDAFGGWNVEGDAFGKGPTAGTAAGQNTVSGFTGKKLLNSFAGNGDGATGRILSKPFTIERRFIHLLVGGGDKALGGAINLLVDGKAVLSASGKNDEKLEPVQWEVSDLRGKTAQMEITDQATGGWGHINVDDIVFSDEAGAPFKNPETLQRLADAMPLEWNRAARSTDAPKFWRRAEFAHGIKPRDLKIDRHYRFHGIHLRNGAEIEFAARHGVPLIVTGSYGKGRVVFVNGQPEHWAEARDGKTVLGTILALALETKYTPQTGLGPEHPQYGTMALHAAAENVSACPQWDDFDALWKDFAASGTLKPGSSEPSAPGRTWNGALAAPMRLNPGESKAVTFTLAWHFPNRWRDEAYGWGPPKYQYDQRLGNQYANFWRDAHAVLDYMLTERERLERETRLYHETFYDSTLPHWFLDAINANTAIVRSPIYVWTGAGAVGGFEGADRCCPMNCTHVYNYAMTMPYLYPELERKVREIDLLHNMDKEKHFLPHRTVLPLELPRLGDNIGGPQHHALDGELGGLLKLYREWRACGDGAFLDKLWPNAKKMMEHVLRDHDVDGDGVFKSEQPNTYDTHLYGSNTFIGTLYLGALRAMEELAKVVGDEAFAKVCEARFRRGSHGYNQRCWNGEYFVNNFDSPTDKPEVYNQDNCYGPGCHADQLLGQWWAHMLGLGYLLPRQNVRRALESLYKYTWRTDLSKHQHKQRVFAEGNEKGLLTCAWPKGGRPERPQLYCDEVWTGLEYHAAATMIYEGMIDEGMQIVKGARDRYTGEKRNPYAEIECGDFYARAMSSWSLLHAAGGYDYDAGAKRLSIAPHMLRGNFRAFISTGTGWGTVWHERKDGGSQFGLDVKYGSVVLNRLSFPQMENQKPAISRRVHVDNVSVYSVNAAREVIHINFPGSFTATPEKPLRVNTRHA